MRLQNRRLSPLFLPCQVPSTVLLDMCSMENYTDADDRELVVTQAQIRMSYPLDRVNGNYKKRSVFFVLFLFFTFTKCISSMVSYLWIYRGFSLSNGFWILMILYLFQPPARYFYPQLCAHWTPDCISSHYSASLEKLERFTNFLR